MNPKLADPETKARWARYREAALAMERHVAPGRTFYPDDILHAAAYRMRHGPSYKDFNHAETLASMQAHNLFFQFGLRMKGAELGPEFQDFLALCRLFPEDKKKRELDRRYLGGLWLTPTIRGPALIYSGPQ